MLVLASLTDGFDKSTGQLQPHDQVAIPEDAAGPRHMVFHPNGNFAFVLNELQNTVTCCSYSPAEGRLSVLGDSISAIIIPTTAACRARELYVPCYYAWWWRRHALH